MNGQENIPWNEISAFLKQKADRKQREKVATWLKVSDENPTLLREIIATWQLTRRNPRLYQPEEDVFWKELALRIKRKKERKIFAGNFSRWIAAAAIVILIFLSGMWSGKQSFLHRPGPLVYSSVVVPPGSRTQTVLPDGTRVWLNSGAKLRYPVGFSADSREVYASGECYFEVARDKKHRFIVHCSELSIQVFGTTFNVNENANSGETVVSLIEGKVKITNSDEQVITSLSSGKQLVFSNGRGIVSEAKNLQALTSWINNSLIFEDQPLPDVVARLEGWYGVKIWTDPRLLKSGHRYTFKVKTESLKEVLGMISMITPVTYKIEGENVSIGYK